MVKALILGAVIAVALCSFARPAGAVTATLSLNGPTSGTCPVTVGFSGTITGLPASSPVSYYFGRFDLGPHTPQVNTTSSPSGTLSVTDSVVIDSAHAGTPHNDQIYVLPPYNVYSNTVTFTVTCLGAGPPAPTSFQQTTSPGECGNHVVPLFGGIVCGAALSNGQLVLDWQYGDPSSVDGFRIYQTNGGYKLVDNQSGMTAKALTIKAADAKGNCYIVRAYKGSAESADSNQACVSGGANTATLTFGVARSAVIAPYGEKHNGAFYCPLYQGGIPASRAQERAGGELVVGFSDKWDPGTQPFPCYDKADFFYRSAFAFDLTSLAGRSMWKATLTMQIDKAFLNRKPASVSCASELMIGTGAWNSASLPGEAYLNMPGGTSVTIDVSAAVRKWLNGQTNFGFVMRGPQEGFPEDNNECATFYGNPQLQVQVFN